MFARYRVYLAHRVPPAGLLFVASGLLIACVSCNGGITATDLALAKMDEAKANAGTHHQHMIDNAMLHDMTVVDHYFVPHTAELSGTGAHRLDRLAPYLMTYGGVVRYQSYAADNDLADQRIDHVREYLALAGCDMDRVQVKRMISGGRGLPAEDAIEVQQKGTVDSSSGGSSTPIMLPTGGMPSQGSSN